MDKNAVHLIESKSSSVDLTDLAKRKRTIHFGISQLFNGQSKITFTNNVDFFEKIGHVNKTGHG